MLKKKKNQTSKERHEQIMRAKYGALMMGYEAAKDRLDEKAKPKKEAGED